MWRQAATAFDKAKADGLPITASTYTFAINAMSKGGRWVRFDPHAASRACTAAVVRELDEGLHTTYNSAVG